MKQERREEIESEISTLLIGCRGEFAEGFEQGFIGGAEFADETMIEKACRWLSLNMKDVAYFGMNGDLYKPEFIQNFREAMEG